MITSNACLSMYRASRLGSITAATKKRNRGGDTELKTRLLEASMQKRSEHPVGLGSARIGKRQK